MKLKVSVNITTCNRAELLPRCLDHVSNQSYSNLEINVINDASTDSTDAILENFRKMDPRIRVFRNEERMGNAASRNRLLKESSGDLVAFLDDDDFWMDPDKLTKQVEQIQLLDVKQPLISCTGVVFETTEGLHPHSYEFPGDIVPAILKGNGFIFNSTVLTTRRTLELTKGFDETLKRGVDSEFFRSCILDHAAQICFNSDATTVCRVFGHRMTTSKSFKSRRDVAMAHLHIIKKHRKLFAKYPASLASRLLRLLASIVKP